jgi:hypothetical protein
VHPGRGRRRERGGLRRTGGHRFKALVPHASQIKALRLLVRLRKDFVRTLPFAYCGRRSVIELLRRIA